MATRRRFSLPLALLAGLALSSGGARCGDGHQFEEVTGAAGIDHVGASYGLAWGDLDGDGLPDLFATNHGDPPSLWLNQGDGTFTDVAPALLGEDAGDVHAPTWADFDGDGDLDLFEVAGRAGSASEHPNRLWTNEDGVLVDQAQTLGIALPYARGRTGMWFDFDRDGRLDVVLHNVQDPLGEASDLHLNQGPGFVSSGLLPENSQFRTPAFALVDDLDADSDDEMISFGTPFPSRVYEMDAGGFTQVDPGLPDVARPQDAVVADLDGDLRMDLFVVRSGGTYSQIVPGPANRLRALLRVEAGEHGFDFRAPGSVEFVFDHWNLPASRIQIGSEGLAPPGPGLRFTLDPADPAHQGLAPHVPGTDTGIYVGYDATADLWRVRHSSLAWKEARLQADADGPIESWAPVGLPAAPPAPRELCETVRQPCRSDLLFLYRDGSLVDRTAEAGLDFVTECESAAAGDFDNDTDVDLYLVCTGPAANTENRLYLNLGDGIFLPAPSASGAAGSLDGRGEAVAVADYDLDGFLDLFIVNGEGPPPLHEGPHQLYRNRGNDNHWLQIDLVGTISNRDAIGARVYVTADGKAQVRTRSGGFHGVAQDHMRLHFGLGRSTVVEELTVVWPSGAVQTHTDVGADGLIRIVEGDDTVYPVAPLP